MVNDVEFTFEVSGTDYEFKVESFRVTEELSKPFYVSLSLLSSDANITFDELIRKPALLSLYGQGTGPARLFHGVINEARYLGQGRRFARYQIDLVPQVWFLTQRQDCRIFQQATIPDIIGEVLDGAAVTDYRMELTGTYASLDYILQYRETDSQFIQRLMAEHGIWYYFEHTSAAHTMVIVDSNDAISELVSSSDNASYSGAIIFHPEGGGVADREHIFSLETVNRVRSGSVTYSDYNYEQPNIPQQVSSSANDNSDLALFDYPGRYRDTSVGQSGSDYWLAEQLTDSTQIEASGNVMRLIPGYSLNIDEHPRTAINRDYTILAVTHSGQNPQVHEEESSGLPTTYDNHFVCMPRDVEFKAPRLPAPVVDGPQTAVVVGPSGEEIYTDSMGRIKVQFHWDRYGASNEQSSCWVRVSQSMAATSWGAVYLPRIGHEVVVTFLEGDPDRPLVTGAVYNGLNLPPYTLPEHKTRTTIRTQTHKGEGYNELSFEDEADQEEIYIHAQRDMSTKVLNNRYRDIGQDEYLKVGRNQTNEISGDQTETIEGNKTTKVTGTFTETVEQDVTQTYNASVTETIKADNKVTIGENRTVTIGKNDALDIGESSNLTVGASRTQQISEDDTSTIGGNLTVSVTGDVAYKADGAVQMVSGQQIVLKSGSASLTMSSDGTIALSGSAITIEGSDKVIVKGGSVAVN